MCSKMCEIVLLAIILLMTDIVASNPREMMERSYPSYAITINSYILSNSSVCINELDRLKEGIDNQKLWSLRTLDASGIPSPGFIHGNNYWLGIKSQCLDIINSKPLKIHPDLRLNNSKYRNVDEEYSPFELDYFVVRARHNSTIQYHFRSVTENTVTIGLCLPSSCSNEEISKIMNKIFNDRILLINNVYSIDLNLESVNTLKNDYKFLFDWQSITIGIILIMSILMVILGTGYDTIIYQKRLQNNENNNINEDDKLNRLTKTLLCFSAYTNSKLIFYSKGPENAIDAIDGIRNLSLMWIIISHTFFYAFSFVNNLYVPYRLSEHFLPQIISNAAISVDSFFVLGGFLISWSHFKNSRKVEKDSNKNFSFKWNVLVTRIFKRFIRLTPSYILMLGIAEMHYKLIIPLSILQFGEKIDENCSKYWWRNLLYINNFFNFDQICMSWSWYLSADMQFFIIGQILLVLSDLQLNLSIGLFVTLLITSGAIPGYLSYYHEFSYTMDDNIKTLSELYYAPWMRISPYLIGMMTGYILATRKDKLIFNQKIRCLLWIIGMLCLALTVFGLTDSDLSYATVAVYMAFHRIVYAIGVSWVLTACYINYAGIINTILSAKIWIPLSRLSYSVYLINPIVITSLYLLADHPVHIDPVSNITNGFGAIIMSYGSAYVMSLIIDIPYALLINNLLKAASS